MSEQHPPVQPFFTIGVPTYNRHDLLRETLQSILSQGFADFEVIVGNDYTAETLTGELLGISDPRVRFVNYPRNLREVGNMSALLELATGRYFTWLFDDDLYEPDFLQTAHDCLVKTGFPPAFFSSFRMMKPGENFQPQNLQYGTIAELTGREFLRCYSAHRPKIASTSGLFDTVALRSIVGGVEELCASPIGLHCEYLFLVKCALLGRIIYVDAPLYVFRRHPDSSSESTQDLENYLIAGQALVRRSSEVLRHPTLVDDYSANLIKICVIHIITFAYVASRFEFAQRGFGVCTIYRALSRHRKETLLTRKLYARQGGDTGFRSRLAFLRIEFFCRYIILRLLAYYRTLSREKSTERTTGISSS